MSKFEKIIIPLVDENIRSIDLTDAAGFVDSYTYDPDNPSGEKELFLVYDDSKRNSYTQDRAIRFEKSKHIRRRYIKYVNGVPYYVYCFWIRPEVKKFYNGVITLSTEQKFSILQFWSVFNDIVDFVMSNSVLSLDVAHNMPLEDYRNNFADEGFTIYKKGAVSNEIAPFLFL